MYYKTAGPSVFDIIPVTGLRGEPGGYSFIGGTPAATRAASLEALLKSFEFIDRTIGRDFKQ